MPAIRGSQSKRKARRHAAIRDLDQIHADLHSPHHLRHHHDTKAPEDLPAFGQWYCVPCAKWFESEHNFKEADAAVGLTTDNGILTKKPDRRGEDEAMTGGEEGGGAADAHVVR
ncbi:zinc finger protein bud20 [Teratosphaeria destructans]|uniref:Zinc finger protein bud20 n=1 Tax=Teratosphaeria destructans TaxID=418781 RepID=A0A9W7VZK1_9PEZI|nr:zinc finger protein bud20 [Teratosphaeria destructans]